MNIKLLGISVLTTITFTFVYMLISKGRTQMIKRFVKNTKDKIVKTFKENPWEFFLGSVMMFFMSLITAIVTEKYLFILPYAVILAIIGALCVRLRSHERCEDQNRWNFHAPKIFREHPVGCYFTSLGISVVLILIFTLLKVYVLSVVLVFAFLYVGEQCVVLDFKRRENKSDPRG